MIEVKHVFKQFGKEPVLTDVNATFEDGMIHGLVGRNGSGKTVLLKCIAGMASVTSGAILVDGKRIGRDIETPPRLGAIIETPGFLPNYSGYTNLKFLAGIRREIGRDEICSAMTRVGLDPASRKWVGKYSLGMRQRLGIAQAIMEQPTLLLLDEPMNGLDDAGVKSIRRLLRALCEEGRTILLASHNPLDIDRLCDTIWSMNRGTLSFLE
ncbi:MAG: ATP-binding cassette domain-containing protein [Clostridia bacterium]